MAWPFHFVGVTPRKTAKNMISIRITALSVIVCGCLCKICEIRISAAGNLEANEIFQ